MDAFLQHLILKGVNYQTFVQAHATVQYLHLPPPEENGWMRDEKEQIVPVPKTMTQPAAPDAVDPTCICEVQVPIRLWDTEMQV